MTMLIRQSRFPIKQMLTVGLLPNPLKLAFYRSRGAKIGRNVVIGPGAVIVADEIEIGDGATIGFGAYFKARTVQIGRYARIGSATFMDAETISIGEDAKINEQVFVGGLSSPASHLRIGARTILMQHTFINVARPVTIGDDTGIGGRCSIFTHGSWQNQLDGYPVTFAPVTIGSNVWIPWEVFIMPGVTIGDGATIGAKSLVAKDIPAGALAVGSPAKVIRTADQYPVRLDHSQQAEMLRRMVDEFCEYLEYEGLKVARDRAEGFERVTVMQRAGAAHTLLVAYEDALNPELCATAAAVLALTGLDAAVRRALASNGRLWLDLAAKQRGGASNALGEEIVDFLKRFGVRFARSD
jgi:acetyltransferase-like isoleucine patch superfamily enzyme